MQRVKGVEVSITAPLLRTLFLAAWLFPVQPSLEGRLNSIHFNERFCASSGRIHCFSRSLHPLAIKAGAIDSGAYSRSALAAPHRTAASTSLQSRRNMRLCPQQKEPHRRLHTDRPWLRSHSPQNATLGGTI